MSRNVEFCIRHDFITEKAQVCALKAYRNTAQR